ncbi:MAG: glycosyltransferase [Gammaproteobacteria bacterium]
MVGPSLSLNCHVYALSLRELEQRDLPMRILMISDVYFPRINGVSTSIKTFRKELSDLGHEITLIAPEYPQPHEDPTSIMRIPSRYLFVDPEDRMMRRKPIRARISELAQQAFDILHVQTPFVAHYAGLELSRALKIPRVVTYHTHFEEYLYHYLPYLPRALTRFSARWFNRQQCNDMDGIIVPSTAMLDVLRRYGIHKPIEIIATGLQEHFFRRGDGERFRNKHGISANRPVLVHIGRLAHEKNIDFLLHMLVEVVKRVPDVLLIIAGEGPARPHLQKVVSELDLENNVLFVGYLDRDTELLDCYCSGQAFVFASRTETQGLVLLEAMAQSTPVVSLSIMGTRDILDTARGALLAEENIQDFSDKVIAILSNPTLQQRLSTEAHSYAQTWSSRAFAEKKQAFYEKTIQQYA